MAWPFQNYIRTRFGLEGSYCNCSKHLYRTLPKYTTVNVHCTYCRAALYVIPTSTLLFCDYATRSVAVYKKKWTELQRSRFITNEIKPRWYGHIHLTLLFMFYCKVLQLTNWTLRLWLANFNSRMMCTLYGHKFNFFHRSVRLHWPTCDPVLV